MIEISLKSISSPKPPSSLSKTSSTSQWSAAGRVEEPPKSTSSGFSARSSDGVSEPAAQTIASATFDLPEPFGPTTTATPGSSFSSMRVDERLEAADPDRLEVHAGGTL